MNPDDTGNAKFRKSPFGKRGYDEYAVDALVSRIEQTLRGADHLTAADVHTASFAKASGGQRGYREDEVDAFLDHAEQELRRHEDLTRRPVQATPQVAPPLERSRKRWWQRQR